MSVPARQYELAGQLLADGVEESDSTGEPVRAVLFRKAAELGERLGAEAAAGVVDLLERHGFEPRREGDTVVLGNCPFHLLARKHVETVCGMNLHLLRGALATSGDTGYEACLSPAPGRCLRGAGARFLRRWPVRNPVDRSRAVRVDGGHGRHPGHVRPSLPRRPQRARRDAGRR
ncbi:hypothetical protein [Streptomyces sp. IBSBF 3352]|uniref:hypothetical protein n=1 Tax=Streptomyces sp. IBSBF 3352 TaxID=2903523 RepID=UPI002FDBAA38